MGKSTLTGALHPDDMQKQGKGDAADAKPPAAGHKTNGGDAGVIIDVGGTQIRLIGGRVVDGLVQIASASRRGLP